MFLVIAIYLSIAVLSTHVLAVISPNISGQVNPNRYMRAPIRRDGPVNDPSSGYYWIDLGFGEYTVPVIVDSGT
jgi:hypothetical protein